MKVRFQAGADLNQNILLATLRREPSIDFQTALAAGLASLSDREVLAMAASEGRVLVTHDRKTMPRHFAEFIATLILQSRLDLK
jgi:predicted nuclease of predicted toxin-antitoxin system